MQNKVELFEVEAFTETKEVVKWDVAPKAGEENVAQVVATFNPETRSINVDVWPEANIPLGEPALTGTSPQDVRMLGRAIFRHRYLMLINKIIFFIP